MPKKEDKSTRKSPLVGGGVDLDQIGETPEGATQENFELDFDKYAEMLEKQVNGAIYDDEPVPTQTPKVDTNLESTSQPVETKEVNAEGEKLEELERAYSESSREAKRLKSELDRVREYDKYLPIIDALQSDPDLVQHVSNYLDGNQVDTSIRDRLKLPEDFIYDQTEAVEDPNSESSKVLKTYVSDVVQEQIRSERDRTRNEIETSRRADTVRTQRNQLADKYSLSASTLDEVDTWARSHKLNYEDIYFLMNRGSRDQVVAKAAVDDVKRQSEKMSKTPRSLAASGEAVEQKPESPDKQLFDAIFQSMNGGVEIFSE